MKFTGPEDVSALLLTVELPRFYDATFPLEEGELAPEVSPVRIGFDHEGRAGLLGVQFGRPLSPSEVRSIPWQQVIDGAVKQLVWRVVIDRERHRHVVLDGDREHIEAAAENFVRARRSARRVITPELLREVADVYTADGAQAVADNFIVSQRQANRYIARAREEGYLP